MGKQAIKTGCKSRRQRQATKVGDKSRRQKQAIKQAINIKKYKKCDLRIPITALK